MKLINMQTIGKESQSLKKFFAKLENQEENLME